MNLLYLIPNEYNQDAFFVIELVNGAGDATVSIFVENSGLKIIITDKEITFVNPIDHIAFLLSSK